MTQNNLKSQFTFISQFVFRTPLLPFKINNNLFETEESIKSFFLNTEIQEAIFLASPILHKKFEKWTQNQLFDHYEKQKLIESLYKYYVRMQTRCTPFGLFAGCGYGNWGNTNNIIISKTSRHTRLDMNISCNLAQNLVKNKSLKNHLNYFPNNSIYKVGEQLRYINYQLIEGKYIYQISSVDNNPYLINLLEFSENGACIHQLIQFLINRGIFKEDAHRYVEDIIDSQLLTNEISPIITGEEYVHQLIKKLTILNVKIRSEEINFIIKKISTIFFKIELLDNNVDNNISLYYEIINELQNFELETNNKVYFQTNLFINTKHATIDFSIQNELNKVITFLNKIYPNDNNFNLNEFIKNYTNRYSDEEMPLLQILDPEYGIGYINSDTEVTNELLKKIDLIGSIEESELKISGATEILLRKFISAQKEKHLKIQLNDADFGEIDHTTEQLPPTMYAFFSIIDKNTNKIYFQNCGNGINLISRFAHGDNDIHEIAKGLSQHEEESYPNKILAEIIYLPDSRTGNILLRPVLKDYEIPFIALSSVDREHQICLKDLVVKIVEGKVVLKSKKLNMEIVPRLSSAHNFSTDHSPIYRFLCDLQSQYYEKSVICFKRESIYELFSFTPRVEYYNTIISPATWNLKKNDLIEIMDIDAINFQSKLKEWKTKWNMPNLICLTEDDNKLLVNLEDEISIRVFINTIKKKHTVILTEYLFEDDKALIYDASNDVYNNECIAFLIKTKIENSKSNNTTTNLQNVKSQFVKRRFIMGEEWLYYKLYCGIKMTDKILTNGIQPLITQLINENLINRWFFVRYKDTDFHIRLRLRLVNVNLINIVIKRVNHFFKKDLENNLIYKLQTDTYIRELERYGSSNIDEVEHLFQIDSATTVEMLLLLKNGANVNIRWLYAIKCMDDIFSAFSVSTNKKYEISSFLFNSFFFEHGGNKKMKIQLDNKYRKYKKFIYFFMNPNESHKNEFSNIFQLLNKKRILINHIADKIKIEKDDSNSKLTIDSLVSTIIHMTINRIFIVRQRTNELVLYHMLTKFYQSELVLAKLNEKKNINDKY